MPDPVPAATRGRPHWPSEWRGALNATAAMLPFVLSYGFIAFGALGAAAAQSGLSASVTSVVLGGLLLSLAGRLVRYVPPAALGALGALERLGGWQAGALAVALCTALLVWVITRMAPRAPAAWRRAAG